MARLSFHNYGSNSRKSDREVTAFRFQFKEGPRRLHHMRKIRPEYSLIDRDDALCPPCFAPVSVPIFLPVEYLVVVRAAIFVSPRLERCPSMAVPLVLGFRCTVQRDLRWLQPLRVQGEPTPCRVPLARAARIVWPCLFFPSVVSSRSDIVFQYRTFSETSTGGVVLLQWLLPVRVIGTPSRDDDPVIPPRVQQRNDHPGVVTTSVVHS